MVIGITVTYGPRPGARPRSTRARHDGRRRPVHPGGLDHPRVVLPSLRDTAAAVDEHLTAQRGFGIADVLHLAPPPH
ncbi:hypothetical protein [Streptomyces sp. NPDC094049]|uniref:hypothetical protein n=1 Tax=Streptomyces sp. NPDC094049 TaxID=3154987 RepID=UPI00331E7440